MKVTTVTNMPIIKPDKFGKKNIGSQKKLDRPISTTAVINA